MNKPCTYILFSKRANRYYTGSSSNFCNRFGRHNTGKVKSTKYAVPWTLVWKEECTTYSEARRLELKIKKRGAKRFLEDLDQKK